MWAPVELSGQSGNYVSIESNKAGYVNNISNNQLNSEAKQTSENAPKMGNALIWGNANRLFFKTKNNRSENIGLVSWCDSDISAGGGTKKGRMKSRQTVAKRYVSYFFVSPNYTPEFDGFKYQAAGLPAVA